MNRTISIDQVVTNGFCVGCGACRVKSGGSLEMQLDEQGLFRPAIETASPQLLQNVDAVCPFSDASADETALGEALFRDKAKSHDPRVGFYASTFAGRIADDALVQRSSSGGLTTWAAAQLLRSGEIDGVIHVGALDSESRLFEYSVSESLEQLYEKTKSRYYTVCFSDVVLKLRGNGRRYLFIGVPCFVKAMRLLCREDEVLHAQIPFCFALICGHLKSPAFAELFAWQMGVPPPELGKFDFRVKDSSQPAPKYSVQAWRRPDGDSFTRSAPSLYGSNWGHAFFQLKACDACDDVMGELADATFGDAWLPEYDTNWRGTSIVICRSDRLDQLLQAGLQAAEIELDVLDVERVVKSQAGNYRHRWDGLSVRSQDAQRQKLWFPKKRVQPGSRPTDIIRKRIVRARVQIAVQSHPSFLRAKQKGDLQAFMDDMRPLTDRMKKLHVQSMNREAAIFYARHPAALLRKLVDKSVGLLRRLSK